MPVEFHQPPPGQRPGPVARLGGLAAPGLAAPGLAARFQQLTELANQHRPLWVERPFARLPCSWEEDWPALSVWLRSLAPAAIDVLEETPEAGYDAAPPVWRALNEQSQALTALNPLAGSDRVATEPENHPWASYRVPGRKWEQIEAFSRAASAMGRPTAGGGPLVDWCAGKGHLGRTLALRWGLPMHAVERTPTLCTTGVQMAERLGVQAKYTCADVLSADAESLLREAGSATSLHACGVLTDTLLAAAVTQRTPWLMVAMCCYHNLGGASRYVPRSALGRELDLDFSAEQLRLPTADEVVAGPAIRAMRRRELAYRLGFDQLIREGSGIDAYTPIGPLPPSWFREPFTAFCWRLAERFQLPLPSRWNGERAEAAGVERARLSRALGLVRCVFRRPLELWLVLDRALGMVDAGRPVVVGTFCDRRTTPRNIAIFSRKERDHDG